RSAAEQERAASTDSPSAQAERLELAALRLESMHKKQRQLSRAEKQRQRQLNSRDEDDDEDDGEEESAPINPNLRRLSDVLREVQTSLQHSNASGAANIINEFFEGSNPDDRKLAELISNSNST